LLHFSSTGAQPSRLPMVASEDACAPISKSLHRIVTTRAKRLTAQQSPNRHARSFDCAMSLNRFARVLRTGRNKSTGRWQPRRDYRFVKLQKRNQNKPHLWSAVASAARHRFGFARKRISLFQSQSAVAASPGSPARHPLGWSICRRTPIILVAQPAPPAQQSYETL